MWLENIIHILYVYMYVYVHVCVCIYMYNITKVELCLWIHREYCMYACEKICACTYVYVCVRARACQCCTDAHAYTCKTIYVAIIHKCVQTHICFRYFDICLDHMCVFINNMPCTYLHVQVCTCMFYVNTYYAYMNVSIHFWENR